MKQGTIETQRIGDLKSFYTLMAQTRDVRFEIVKEMFSSQDVRKERITALKNALDSLEESLDDGYKTVLKIDGSESIDVDVTYEVTELKKRYILS
jgi:hypothetical protein